MTIVIVLELIDIQTTLIDEWNLFFFIPPCLFVYLKINPDKSKNYEASTLLKCSEEHWYVVRHSLTGFKQITLLFIFLLSGDIFEKENLLSKNGKIQKVLRVFKKVPWILILKSLISVLVSFN